MLIIKELLIDGIEYFLPDPILLIGGSSSFWYLFEKFPFIFPFSCPDSGLNMILRAANAKVFLGGIYLLFRFTDLGLT